MVEANLEYEKDPVLLAEIVSAFPKRIESTLNLHKSKILGSLPTSRDDFDPTSLLAKLEGGEKILFMDSNKDLPMNWKTIDMKEAFGCSNVEVADTDAAATDDAASTDDAATTDEAVTTDEDCGVVEEVDEDEYQDVVESTVNLDKVDNPPRVLVFTTVMLLGLLAVSKYGSVDGTFKAMTKKWKQFFVFMLDY
jgi:hypothetical protein